MPNRQNTNLGVYHEDKELSRVSGGHRCPQEKTLCPGKDSRDHLMKKYQAKGVIFALEPTGIYWKSLGYALHDRGCLVHLVNPVQVHYKRKEEDPAANKNDKIDPGLICDLVCDGKSNPARFMLGIFRLL